jgi:hypothetical protein
MPDMDATMAAVWRAVQDRDRGDLNALLDKVGQMHYAGQTWPINPAKFGAPTDLEQMRGQEAADRLNKYGEISVLAPQTDANTGQGIPPEEARATFEHLMRIYNQVLAKGPSHARGK